MFAFRASAGPVDLAFTDRYGGVSGVPFDELNLGINTTDDPDAVATNTQRVLAAFAPDVPDVVLADMEQVHGDTVLRVEDGAMGPAGDRRPACDGLVTGTPDVVLMVRVADCVPVVLADLERPLVGVVHAGRPGLAAGVVPRAVARLRDQGAGQLTAWLGPAVCGHCYEVPVELQEQVATVEPAARATTSWGTPALDIVAGVRAQLERDGVEVTDVSRCTRESDDLYSYRRDGAAAGRQAGLVRIRGGRG